MEKELKEIKECVQEIKTAILGDLNNPQNLGMRTEIDRLKQSKKFKDKILWIVMGNLAYIYLERLL